MAFQKGHKFSKGGTPKWQRDAQRRVKKAISDNAEHVGRVIGECLNSEDEKIRWAAAQYCTDRLLGKPSQQKDVSISGSVEVDASESWIEAMRILGHEARAAKLGAAKVIDLEPADEQPRTGKLITVEGDANADARKQRFAERHAEPKPKTRGPSQPFR